MKSNSSNSVIVYFIASHTYVTQKLEAREVSIVVLILASFKSVVNISFVTNMLFKLSIVLKRARILPEI